MDVNQRKGKVISLFDVKLVLDYEGKVGENAVAGTISVPEVSYDTEIDEYVFDIAITGESREKQSIREMIRSKLVPDLRLKLAKFGPDLIETHAKDIQHPVAENRSTFTSAHQSTSQAPSSSKASASLPSKSSKEPAYNTTSLKLESTFNTTAAELYTTFLDPGRVAAWSRSPPNLSPVEGGEFSLFDGNVNGKFNKLVQDQSIEMSWRLKTWKAEHFASLTLLFDQGQGETKVKVNWQGVPIGEEDITRRNFEEYYIKAIKLTFGFGAVL